MKQIPFINIADTDCWIIYLMPFIADERTDYESVNQLQQACIKNRIFGMGWEVDCFDYGTPMTEENASEYVKRYNHQFPNQDWSVSEDAVNRYKSIKKGDYVIMRLKNSHYYVGRVSSEGAFYIHKSKDDVYELFSWGGTVDKWIEYENDSQIPSEIIGRFSQRLHSTIQRIAPYRQRLLVISMYESHEQGDRRFDIPKLNIGERNFVRSLNYMELEDLVAIYIANKHEPDGYRLLPSSCKVSQQNYEFRFVAKGKKPITCQVKNQHTIEIDHYLEENSYERIYIFSGKWNEDEVAKIREQYHNYSHIDIISPRELFETLKNDNPFENNFYDFVTETLPVDSLPLGNYNLCKMPKAENDYLITENKDFACFIKKDGLFYSTEFKAVVLSWHILNDRAYEMSCIEKIMLDINR